MELVTPDIGLLAWMTLVFLILLFLLRKFAWKPILKALHDRENSIENALKSAENAKAEMAKLGDENKKLMLEARHERELLLKEAETMKNQIIAEAKEKASIEADRIITQAKADIQSEKQLIVSEIKSQIASLSIEIAEKVLKEELADKAKQQSVINDMLQKVNIN